MYLKKIIVAVLLFFLSLFGLGELLKLLPHAFYAPHKFLIQGGLKVVISCIVIYFIRKERFFNKDYFFRNKIVSICACVFIVYGALSITFSQVEAKSISLSNYSHYSYLFFNMSTGFLEELLFRVLLFGNICQLLHNESRQNYYREVLVTSLLFGMLHLFNLRVATCIPDVLGVLNQTLLAMAIGVILQSIFFRFQNIILNGILHGVINYSGTRQSKLLGIGPTDDPTPVMQQLTQSLILTAVFTLLFAMPIMYFCVKGRENKIVRYQKTRAVSAADA